MITDVEVIDDAFDDTFLEYCEHYYFGRLKWVYGHVSTAGNHGTRFFFGAQMDDYKIDDCPITDYIKTVTQKAFNMKIAEYEDLYMNGHTYQLDGNAHIDQHLKDIKEQKFTVMMMPNFFKEEDENVYGGFEFMQDTKIDYKPGRLIMFPSNLSHRGLSTNSKRHMRMTLVWKNCVIKRPYIIT